MFRDSNSKKSTKKKTTRNTSSRQPPVVGISSKASKAPSRKRYNKNFLKQVIARVDFTIPLLNFQGGPPKSIVDIIKKRFPIAEPKKQVVKQITYSAESGMQQTSYDTYEWIYHSRNRSKLLHIHDNAMFVEYKKYKSFEILQDDFLTALDALFDVVNGLLVKRLGLRYIDKIEFPKERDPIDWSRYLHSDLLSSFNIPADPKTIARSFNVLNLNFGDMHLKFQYGMSNPDFPAVIKKKMFVLDYDASCSIQLEKGEISGYLCRFHDLINSSFEQVITNSLRKKMEVISA